MDARTTMEQTGISFVGNNEVVIRLLYTINHLSRWLSPIHGETALLRTPRRGGQSIKQLMIELRDEEMRVFPRMHAIAVQDKPDLDRLPPLVRTPADLAFDEQARVIELMAEFRRLRQSTTSLLRSLPDDAWKRIGTSRLEHDWTIRMLAESLVLSDTVMLSRIDRALAETGARSGIATVSKAPLNELQRLAR